jgi:hypothetical protein
MNPNEMIEEFGPTEPTVHGSLFVDGRHICDGTLCINKIEGTGRLNFESSVSLQPPQPYACGLIKQSSGLEHKVADVTLCTAPQFPHLHFRILTK